MADSDATAQSSSLVAADAPDKLDVSSEARHTAAADALPDTLALEFGADGLARARQLVKQAATAHGASASVAFEMQLAVSELATNALHHGAEPASVRVRRIDQGLVLEVFDSGAGAPSRRDPSPRDANGRGLLIVSSVAADWGVVTSDRGKTVWCRFVL